MKNFKLKFNFLLQNQFLQLTQTMQTIYATL